MVGRMVSVASLLLALFGTGCTTLRPISLETVRSESPERIRVTTAHDQISISHPALIDGTLSGQLLSDRNQPTGLTWSAPVEQIVEVAVRVRAQGQTAAAIILGAPAAAYAIYLVAFLVHCSSGECG